MLIWIEFIAFSAPKNTPNYTQFKKSGPGVRPLIHCKNIRYRLISKLPSDRLPTRTCDCSYCLKQNGIYTSDPDGRLEYSVTNRTDLNCYQFGHKTANFYVCKKCGVMSFILSEIEGKVYGIVNLCALGDLKVSTLPHDRRDFEKESLDERASRRKKYWIGNVVENASLDF